MAESATHPAPVDAGAVPTPADEQPGFKVFAGNLAYTTNDEGLKTFFSPVADDIVSCQVILRGTRSAGYGFVAFNTAEAASKAVDLLNKKELDGRTLIIEIAKPAEEKQREKKEKRASKKRTSKKANTDAEPTTNGTADPATKDTAEGNTAPEGSPKPKKKRNTRKPKKAKSAEKEKDTSADDGAAVAPAVVEPKPKKVKAPKAPKPPKPTRPVGEAPEGEPSKTMLFVANLGFSVDDAALSDLFTAAGITVISARVVRRRWGQPRRSKGYGFVDVGSEEQQKKAIELLQGKEIGGREIVVKIAVNSQEREAEESKDATGEAAPHHNVPSLVAAAA